MEVTFSNVTITLTANTPAEAYTLLCNTLATEPSCEWQTDTFDTNGADGNLDPFRDVSELYPPTT